MKSISTTPVEKNFGAMQPEVISCIGSNPMFVNRDGFNNLSTYPLNDIVKLMFYGKIEAYSVDESGLYTIYGKSSYGKPSSSEDCVLNKCDLALCCDCDKAKRMKESLVLPKGVIVIVK